MVEGMNEGNRKKPMHKERRRIETGPTKQDPTPPFLSKEEQRRRKKQKS
jgi:hypothetical protein